MVGFFLLLLTFAAPCYAADATPVAEMKYCEDGADFAFV
jgi:hypothetical protein